MDAARADTGALASFETALSNVLSVPLAAFRLAQAPEVIMRRGTTKAADYWALGVLIFEMLVGDPPFKSLTNDPWDTFRRTLSGRFYVPNFISDDAADLIFKLLQVCACVVSRWLYAAWCCYMPDMPNAFSHLLIRRGSRQTPRTIAEEASQFPVVLAGFPLAYLQMHEPGPIRCCLSTARLHAFNSR